MSVPLVVSGRPLPAVGMPEKAQRRRFSVAYKQKILREAARCTLPGELGALVRRLNPPKLLGPAEDVGSVNSVPLVSRIP